MTPASAWRGKVDGAPSSNQRSRYDRIWRSASVGAHLVLHRAQVLAHDEGAGSVGLEGQEVEQVVVGVTNVGAVAGPDPRRDPVQPEQAHDVVDADAAAVGERRPHRVDERLVTGRSELPRHERRQAPVLAERVEGVGRRTHAAAFAQQVLERPRIGAVGVEPDGEVGHDVDAGTARHAQLAVQLPLAPLVKPHPAPFGNGQLGDGRRCRVAVRRRPPRPRRPVALGQHAPHGEVHERFALAPHPFVEGVVAGAARFEHGVQPGEGVELEAMHGVAIDAFGTVERAPGFVERREVGAQRAHARQLRDADVGDVAPQPRRRRVRARLLRLRRGGGVQRVDHQHAVRRDEPTTRASWRRSTRSPMPQLMADRSA